MPLGYKYAERSADSDVNWFEIGKELTDTLSEANRIREEKKEAYNQATREDLNNLANAPQGQDQDANGFTNNFAHDMINQMKIDEDLFKRGLLKERDYTLKRQNNVDGTNQLYEIQKLYQENYAEKMEGVTSGKLQAMNIFNMGMVEGYGDFNNSKATINPNDGTVGIGLMENKMIDGKMVRVLSKNIAPVNVIRGKILQNVPTFDVDSATKKTVEGFGIRKNAWYEAATTAGAGSITEYTGPDFLSRLKDPTSIKLVKDIDKAVDDQVGFYFSNPYNLTSVMTENLGKYNSDSFTFEKDVADKDPDKILVKIDPNTKMTTIDDKGKNYDAQKQEAADWVKRDIYRKMDEERNIKTTAQNQLQQPRAKTSDELNQANMEKDAKNFAVNTSNFLYGTDAQKKEAITYFAGMGADIMVNPVGKPKGNYIMNEAGKYVLLQTEGGDVTAGGRAAIGSLLRATGQNFPQDLVFKNMKIGKNFNTTFSGTGLAEERDVQEEYKTNVIDKIKPELFTNQKVGPTVAKLKVILKDVPGIQVVEENPNLPGNNTITVSYMEGATPKTIELNSNEDEDTAAGYATDLQKILEAVPETGKLKAIGKEKVGGTAQSRIGGY